MSVRRFRSTALAIHFFYVLQHISTAVGLVVVTFYIAFKKLDSTSGTHVAQNKLLAPGFCDRYCGFALAFLFIIFQITIWEMWWLAV